jgi:hypothetical protein
MGKSRDAINNYKAGITPVQRIPTLSEEPVIPDNNKSSGVWARFTSMM